MSTSRPFSYNTGSAIEGTIQVGTLAVGTTISGFTNNPKFWEGPDEELGYVIAAPQSGNTQPTPVSGVTASVQFFRTTSFAENEFISLSQYVSKNFNTPQTFSSGTDASTWLTANGYWNSWIPLTLGWDDIANADLLVGDASNVADWNTYFDLPTNGIPFSSVIVTGNTVNLYGGSNINLRDDLFSYNLNLLSVVDEVNCITTAGQFSFGDCSEATLFDLPSLTTANAAVFYNCYSVTTFNLPSLTTGSYAFFNGCTSVTTFNLPLLTYADSYCFVGCYSVTTFNLPSVTYAGGEYVFAGCSSVTTFNLPALTTAGYECFSFCSSLTTVNLPSLTTAGDYCFFACFSTTTYDLPSLTTAGQSCFQSSESVTTFDLPSLTTAGDSCFNLCFLTTTFNLPSLTTAGGGCFSTCESVTTFDLPSLTTAGQSCFYSCISVTTFDLPSCTNLGGTTGDNFVFDSILGNTITLTIPASRMTCDSGNPDGDIQYLQANNTVTVITT
jgi:hypothetical protein